MNAVRLALGTLTVFRVPAPTRIDRTVAGRAMALAPGVGLLLGLLAVAGLWLLGGGSLTSGTLPAPVAATLVVTAVSAATRGIHLDGLADTADGLGSARPAAAALEVMRRGEVGPFGVLTLVLSLLLQVTALTACLVADRGPGSVVAALVVGRAALPLVCRSGVPSARADGLGSTVAGSVGPVGLGSALLLVLVVVGGVLVLGGLGPVPEALPRAALAVVLPLGSAWLLCRRCVRRLGGVTGDVLGACVEVATTTCLVVLSLG